MDDGLRHERRDTPVTLRLHIKLREAVPAVWRRVEVASDLGLEDLHDVLQAVFGWQDYHLYRFTTGPERDPGAVFACAADLAEGWGDDPAVPMWDVRVDELLAEVGERLYYQYDYGDNWWLAIEVEEVVDGGVPPGRANLVDGAGAGPPEDCGGVGGYETIVAAADPTHTDHRQALADVEAWWGREVSPGEVGLVPFDLSTVADQLEALDLSARPPVPRYVGSELAALLLRARTTDTARQLRELASAADGEVDIDEATAEQMTRPLQVLFDAVGDEVKLTAAGYLPPAVVRTIFEALDLAEEWIGKGNREDQTLPVLELREATQRMGLLRKHKGRLLPTSRARKLAADPVALWWHLASRLPIGGRDASDAGWQAGVLLLALMASGSTEDAETRIAQLLTGLGWAIEDRQPIDQRTASGLVAGDLRLLRRVGALEGGRSGRQVTAAGVQLARAALADQQP